MYSQPEDKGKLNGKCNRGACWNRPAICYSTVERAYYCVTCARQINVWIPKGVAQINIPQEPKPTYSFDGEIDLDKTAEMEMPKIDVPPGVNL